MTDFLSGLIVRAQSGFFTVETGEGAVVCGLRGRIKRGPRTGDLAAVGDRVRVTRLADGSGVIEEVEPRRRAIVRLDPRPLGVYQQILLANPDQAVFVFACAQPRPRLRMLDRFLVVAEKQRIPAIVVANKIDLADDPRKIFGMYEDIGYRVIYLSAKTAAGMDELRAVLADKISALAGPSGAGKSSLLNALQPGLGLAVNEVSAAMGKGKHTTVTRQLIPLPDGGYVADTPGWKSLALWDTEPEEMDAYFPELAPLVAECQFSDCTHEHEPGCAVRAALEAGKIHPERYESYLRLRAGQE
ncbi:MAG: Small ribosomal subunit biogenesis GTPase RsgA [Anaerolineales bacterium]|jgi:ribosome biogenesis GTPase|nr:Small ribosomal subunit biogenesis GTPase RsgA [Anaerolineales bacterium]GER78573.1 ribosome small subunit-dependent GTPase A [Candidatus Denitrolinea symbiosum]MBW7918779.1 ribosome small subunit-dependent GTPase A [Anaerolineales bacterium]MCZ2287980.1 ribosome small subunit-dependent GTPase A [Anaerolineales bacterium]MDX9935704.1 ribosome small subunit-dependent GTPase A [Anaerolineales bacterium]